MQFERVFGAGKVYSRVVKQGLFLPRGRMRGSLLSAMEEDTNVIGLFGKGCVGVLLPNDNAAQRWLGQLYVSPKGARKGVGRALVKALLEEASFAYVRFTPWDVASGQFFNRLIEEMVLHPNHNFTPVDRAFLLAAKSLG